MILLIHQKLGGKNQPNCPAVPGKLLGAIFNIATVNVEGFEETTACSHIAALTFYIESITDKSCDFVAYPCDSEDDFNTGKCIKCSSKGCNKMGYYSSPNLDLGSLYLNTQDPALSPLCLQNYALTLYSHNLNNIKQARGRFSISFKTDSQETSSTEIFDNSETTFKQDSVETRLISLKKPLTKGRAIQSAIISYTKTTNLVSSWLYDAQWSFKYIEISSGYNQDLVKLCPTNLVIDSGKSVEFKKC